MKWCNLRGLVVLYTVQYSTYNFCSNKAQFMYLTAYLQRAGLNNKSATTFQSSEFHFGIDWSLKMRYCMKFYLNRHKNCEKVKLNMCFLLSKFESSNSDLSQFLCQLRQKFIQYLILKLQSMPKWNSEDQNVVALLLFKPAC